MMQEEEGSGGATPVTFDSVGALFNSRPSLEGRTLKWPEDYSRTFVPICQHNIYKYSPFTFEKVEGEETYRIIFPESKRSLIAELDIPFESEITELIDATEKYPPKCEEEAGQRLLEIRFRPTEHCGIEDLRYQLYLSHVNLYNLEQWFNPLKDLEVQSCKGQSYSVLRPSVLIDLTPEEVGRIEDLHEKASFGRYLGPVMHDITVLAKDLAPRMVSQFYDPADSNPRPPFFIKMNTRSPKDSWFYKEQGVFSMIRQLRPKDESDGGEKAPPPPRLKKCQALTPVDVISALVGSTRVYEDCKSYRQWKVKKEHKPPLVLVMQEWMTFPEEFEFRCFIYEGQLNALNQLCWSKYIPEIEEDEELQARLVASVQRLQKAVHPLLPFQNYILDIIYNKELDSSTIVEFNPWGPYSCTGSQLFSWELDWEILFGKTQSHLPEEERKPSLLLLRPGMKVLDQFHLYYAKDCWVPSEAFLERLKASTPRCPCCHVPADPFKKKVAPEKKPATPAPSNNTDNNQQENVKNS